MCVRKNFFEVWKYISFIPALRIPALRIPRQVVLWISVNSWLQSGNDSQENNSQTTKKLHAT